MEAKILVISKQLMHHSSENPVLLEQKLMVPLEVIQPFILLPGYPKNCVEENACLGI
jgi:hypothetical protein